jgi:hypothetical protein
MRALSRLTIAVLLAFTGALAACGDDGDSGTDISLEDREGQERDDSDDTDDSDEDADPDDDDTDEPDDADDELPADAEPYIEALTGTFAGDESLPIPEDQARCIATNIVGIIRLERLTDAGLTPEAFAGEDLELSTLGLEAAEGLEIMDAFGDCDFDFYDALVTSLSADAADPAIARACMEAAVTPEQLRETMARGFIEGDAFDDSPEADAVFGPLFACSFGEDTDG